MPCRENRNEIGLDEMFDYIHRRSGPFIVWDRGGREWTNGDEVVGRSLAQLQDLQPMKMLIRNYCVFIPQFQWDS